MTNPVPFERRLAKVEADAGDALALARAHDRDVAELPLKVDANRRAINALGLQIAGRFEQLAPRFEQLDRRFEQVDRRFEQVDRRFEQLERKVDEGFAQADANFAAVRFQLDQTAAGLAHIADLLQRPEPDSG